MSVKRLVSLTVFCISILGLGLTSSAQAGIQENVRVIEEDIDRILVMVAKGQIMASTCAQNYPNDTKLNSYQFKFSKETTKPFSTALAIKRFLDKTVPELTGAKMVSDDPLSLPSIKKASLEVAEAMLIAKDSGLLKKTCSSLVNKNVVLEVMPSQVDYLFESLLTLDEDFPGIYMFMKQRHYEAE